MPSSYSVQNHIREYHIRVSTFKCNACKFVTSSMKQLNFHTQNEHMDEKKFRCPECENYTTMVKRSLIGHLMKIHNLNDNEATERYKNLPSSRCPFCPVTFLLGIGSANSLLPQANEEMEFSLESGK